MIQANELRIGNFVLYKWFDKTYGLIDGYPRQKTVIHREVLSVLAVDGENNRALIKTKQHRKNQTWVSLGKLTPISLTEEILLKCGFEFDSITFYNDVLMLSFNSNFSSASVWVNTFSNGKLNIIIKHLHQLQNLHFALTGEELEMKW